MSLLGILWLACWLILLGSLTRCSFGMSHQKIPRLFLE
ncbi:hypothetical protein GLYMA_08G265150v4 [Glycine max]|nr:hypothetical protein GLYMA_08G265150v4 [Glycine max]KAH1053223.1 hypothetical protein GYH30_022484 [Glycine max]